MLLTTLNVGPIFEPAFRALLALLLVTAAAILAGGWKRAARRAPRVCPVSGRLGVSVTPTAR